MFPFGVWLPSLEMIEPVILIFVLKHLPDGWLVIMSDSRFAYKLTRWLNVVIVLLIVLHSTWPMGIVTRRFLWLSDRGILQVHTILKTVENVSDEPEYTQNDHRINSLILSIVQI